MALRSALTLGRGLRGARSARAFCSAGELKKTLVYDEHLAEEGKMVDFAGYLMPVQYHKKGSPHALSIIDSTKWTREGASLFDVSHMCSIRWTGKNAIDFVERVTTADVRGFVVVQTASLMGYMADQACPSKHQTHAPAHYLQLEMTHKILNRDPKDEILKDETGKISFKNLKRVAKELGEVNEEEFLRIMKKPATQFGPISSEKHPEDAPGDPQPHMAGIL
ncbi:unnamed protein product [Polarella glacialis]|uniref:GCVT N-terminal domain-containing protein n=1 Tax=Polarella glacialis TaxID=89957 RepID=A0A813KTH7_POLGL|nr:unnamed protein product [Polarella glacialis]